MIENCARVVRTRRYPWGHQAAAKAHAVTPERLIVSLSSVMTVGTDANTRARRERAYCSARLRASLLTQKYYAAITVPAITTTCLSTTVESLSRPAFARIAGPPGPACPRYCPHGSMSAARSTVPEPSATIASSAVSAVSGRHRLLRC